MRLIFSLKVDINQPFIGAVFIYRMINYLYMNTIVSITTNTAPTPVGPYSQAIIAGDFIFCSGQISIEGDISIQTEQIINNIEQILKSAEASLADVVKAEIYLKDMNDFSKVNEIYAQKFNSEPKPARVTVEVSRCLSAIEKRRDAYAAAV